MTNEKFEKLKNESLGLIRKYNNEDNHRRIMLVDEYGENIGTPQHEFFAYWSFWIDNNFSSVPLGFTYREGKLIPFNAKQEEISFENAISNLEKQLSEIPPKSL